MPYKNENSSMNPIVKSRLGSEIRMIASLRRARSQFWRLKVLSRRQDYFCDLNICLSDRLLRWNLCVSLWNTRERTGA